jgi:uncharacterized protein YbaA (DUF1428 family)
MTYVDGFVIPVPQGNREAYRVLAAKAAPIFLEHGATRVVETWGDDIKPGKVNDFRTSVIAGDDEQVVFSWIEWPSKEVRDAGMEKVMNDERMKPEDGQEMPFSGERLIYGGFVTIVDTKG